MTVIFLIIQFGMMYFLNMFGVEPDINAYIFIFFNIIYMVLMFIKKYNHISKYLIIAFFSRIIFMFWDLYAQHIFLFPGSGNDTEGYYRSAVSISKNLKLLQTNLYGGVYSKILGAVFYFIGPNRIIGQYINVLLGIGIIIIIYKVLKLLSVSHHNIKLAVILMAVLPNGLIFSAILLRENFITFFVTLSFLYFIRWYKFGGISNQIFSTVFLILSSTFHSGVIGVLIGYLFLYIFFNRYTKSFKFSLKSVFIMILSIILLIVILSYGDLFLNKFSKVETINDLVSTSNRRRGGSQYLSSLQADSWWKMLLFSPIYMIYFLISPLPLNWRGTEDVITFFIDSSFYLYFIYIIYKFRNYINKRNPIILGLVISLISTVFIFGIGVQNAGTAMRHRQKILPLFIILTALIKNNKENAKRLKRF